MRIAAFTPTVARPGACYDERQRGCSGALDADANQELRASSVKIGHVSRSSMEMSKMAMRWITGELMDQIARAGKGAIDEVMEGDKVTAAAKTKGARHCDLRQLGPPR